MIAPLSPGNPQMQNSFPLKLWNQNLGIQQSVLINLGDLMFPKVLEPQFMIHALITQFNLSKILCDNR